LLFTNDENSIISAATDSSDKSESIHPLEVTDGDFDKLLQSTEKPILIDFWAPWCGPCRMLAPTIEELAKEYNGKAIVAKMNTDKNPKTSQKFGIRGIPTIIFFKKGNTEDKFVGMRQKDEYKKVLDRLLGIDSKKTSTI
jgi:thioredoxin 1